MFSNAPQHQTLSSDLNLLTKLLGEKYLNLHIDSVETSVNSQIQVTLLNGRHGVNEGIDEENKRPIEFLKSYGATVSQEKAEYDYWSYSVITLSQSKLKDIINALKLMPTPNFENAHGKVMAAC